MFTLANENAATRYSESECRCNPHSVVEIVNSFFRLSHWSALRSFPRWLRFLLGVTAAIGGAPRDGVNYVSACRPRPLRGPFATIYNRGRPRWKNGERVEVLVA